MQSSGWAFLAELTFDPSASSKLWIADLASNLKASVADASPDTARPVDFTSSMRFKASHDLPTAAMMRPAHRFRRDWSTARKTPTSSFAASIPSLVDPTPSSASCSIRRHKWGTMACRNRAVMRPIRDTRGDSTVSPTISYAVEPARKDHR